MGAKGANFHRDVLDRLGYADACDEIQAHYLAGDRARATAAVPLELVQDIALVGTVEDIRAQLPAWEATAVTTMLVQADPRYAPGDRRRAARTGLTGGMDDDYAEAVLDLVAAIPAGRAMTYGTVAEVVADLLEARDGVRRGGPRQVGQVMSHAGSGVPWWRVVNAAGRPPPGTRRAPWPSWATRAPRSPPTARGSRCAERSGSPTTTDRHPRVPRRIHRAPDLP